MMKNIMTWHVQHVHLGQQHLVCSTESAQYLRELMAFGRSDYPGLQAKNAAVAVSQLEEQALKSSMLPQVKMQAQNSYGTFEGSSGAFFPQAGFFNVSGNQALSGSNVTANSFASATLEWEVLTFGRQQKERSSCFENLENTLGTRGLHIKFKENPSQSLYFTALPQCKTELDVKKYAAIR